jgi:hypothetical protein
LDHTQELADKINQTIGNYNYFYISNEAEHGFGLEKYIQNFVLICLSDHVYLDVLQNEGREFFCLKKDEPNNINIKTSAQLLQYYFEKGIIKSGDFVQTFKIASQFEKFASENNLRLINTSAELNIKFEQKISQLQIFKQFGIKTPYQFIASLRNFSFEDLVKELGTSFVVQFNRGHTGSSTVFIKSKDEYSTLQNKFQNRTARLGKIVDGNAYSLNCCKTSSGIYIGGLYKQITGVSELTSDKGATVGGTWDNQLNSKQLEALFKQINKIKNALDHYGYRGLFGIDFIINSENESIEIIEINARQQMTVAFNSKLNRTINLPPLVLIHICEFFDININLDVAWYNENNISKLKASQLYFREQDDAKPRAKTEIKSGEYDLKGKFKKFEYGIDKINPDNLILLVRKEGYEFKHGDEILRIQTTKSIFKKSSLDPAYINFLVSKYNDSQNR